MKQDLLDLKERLELKKAELQEKESTSKSKKYYEVYYYGDWKAVSKGRTLLEIAELEDTEGFIEKFESLVKSIIREISTTDLPFDRLNFVSYCNFFCDTASYNKAKRNFKDNSGVVTDAICNTGLNYMRVNFEMDFCSSGFYDEDGYFNSFDFCDKESYLKSYDKLVQFDGKIVSGIVDIDKFLKRMEELGYDVYLYGGEPLQNISDCVKDCKRYSSYNPIDVMIAFEPTRLQSNSVKRQLTK